MKASSCCAAPLFFLATLVGCGSPVSIEVARVRVERVEPCLSCEYVNMWTSPEDTAVRCGTELEIAYRIEHRMVGKVDSVRTAYSVIATETMLVAVLGDTVLRIPYMDTVYGTRTMDNY